MKHDISIIVINYNTPDLLRDCIVSIKKSAPKLDYEVIVVDNGSRKPVYSIVALIHNWPGSNVSIS